MTWEWPQITLIALCGITFLHRLVCDGQPQTGRHSLGVWFIDATILYTLLYFGGFWHGGVR